jgi:NAD(P)-dependent dehydrogenase (short-subunit alcohol dehydrogenase family)
MKNIDGRVAVVTGAAGGMGRTISLELAVRGCDIALIDINREGLDESAGLVSDIGR